MHTMDNYIKKWEAMLEEHDAKAKRLSAEERLRYNDWRNNTKAQFDAVGDWTESAWDEFTAKVEQQWHENVIRFTKDDSEK
jgi:hypothetical protein